MAEKEKKSVKVKARVEATFYSNFARVSHSEVDFFIDFVQLPPTSDNEASTTRIYMSPKHAKALIEALQVTIENYEKRFEEIPPPKKEKSTP